MRFATTELADVVITALVAMESLGADVRAVLGACAAKVASRTVASAEIVH